MRNLWIQTENPAATWVADLGPPDGEVLGDPEGLLAFVRRLLEAGQEHEVFMVREAPEVGFEGRNNAELVALLSQAWTEKRELDLFRFTGTAALPHYPRSSTVAARVAWYDRDDRVTEGECVDLGALLRSLDTTDEYIPNGFMVSYPPVRITGPRLRYPLGGGPPTGKGFINRVKVRIELQSDIWLPWIHGPAHPWWSFRENRLFDNRELAERHTPRLNAFLGEARRACEAAGGDWYLDRSYDASGKLSQRWLDDAGVLLDAEPPVERMPPEALDVPWE